MTWGRTLKKALKCKGLPVNFKEWRARVKMNIALRKRALSPVRLVLKGSSKRSLMLFVVVFFQLGSII